ncbi:hypothetical protein BZA77DRAFT_309297 [Pyronema omphalodes]|nr:hypothetical protein BZA77DRAFT_309297 [Pyronema omphalodes]
MDFSHTHSPSWAPNLFLNKVVLCTGGAGSICSVQVAALVKLGCNAVITGRRQDVTQKVAAEIQALRQGAKVIGIAADVRDYTAMENAVKRTVQELGRLDYLICGAAGNFLATISQLSSNAFKSVLDIDILGSFHAVKASLRHLKASRGRIIFISATLHYTGTPYQSHVSAAKAAIDALSQSLAVELGPFGITSNVIAPGPIAGTEGMARLANREQSEVVRRATPLQRFGKASEIADATVYLLADTGSFVNGAVLVVDGGSWHKAGGTYEPYPEIVLGDEVVQGVKGMKSKL